MFAGPSRRGDCSREAVFICANDVSLSANAHRARLATGADRRRIVKRPVATCIAEADQPGPIFSIMAFPLMPVPDWRFKDLFDKHGEARVGGVFVLGPLLSYRRCRSSGRR
jgi:hypothetical protein